MFKNESLAIDTTPKIPLATTVITGLPVVVVTIASNKISLVIGTGLPLAMVLTVQPLPVIVNNAVAAISTVVLRQHVTLN